MNKLDGKTMDLVGDNVAKLKELFPDAFIEGKIDFDALKTDLGGVVDADDERYSFTWHGKQNAKNIALKQSTGTLRPNKADSKNWDTTKNLFVEGDNLEVLRVLQESYRGKIKMIYIDPPYNTGKDFVYEDDFKDNIKNYKEKVGESMRANPESGGRYHTNWLNMMYPRLRLAKNLLTDDGVVFISIDDNEITNLIKISDEIFGEENFIALISVENNPKGRKNSDFISLSNDYCLIYSKNINKSYFVENIPKNINDMTEDEDGNYVHNSGKRVLVGENSFNKEVADFNSEKHYSVYYNDNTKEIITKKENLLEAIDSALIEKGHTRYVSQRNGKFIENTYTITKLLDLFKENALEFQAEKIFEKNFSSSIRMKSLLTNKDYEALINNESQNYKIDVKTTSAGKCVKELFNTDKEYFTAPKNIGLIKILTSLFDKRNFVILDFFAGSATSAHAVMQLNAEDGGNRKFIMVQIPEVTPEDSEARKAGYNTITDIGKERIRRAGEKIKADNKDKEGIDKLDIGFKVFTLDETNLTQWDPNTKDIGTSLLSQLTPLKEGRSDEDAVYEIMLKYGIDLTMPITELNLAGKKVFSLAENYLLICLEKKIGLEVVEEIAKLSPQRVVFYDDGFADDTVKANAEQTLKKAGVEEIMVI